MHYGGHTIVDAQTIFRVILNHYIDFHDFNQECEHQHTLRCICLGNETVHPCL